MSKPRGHTRTVRAHRSPGETGPGTSQRHDFSRSPAHDCTRFPAPIEVMGHEELIDEEIPPVLGPPPLHTAPPPALVGRPRPARHPLRRSRPPARTVSPRGVRTDPSDWLRGLLSSRAALVSRVFCPGRVLGAWGKCRPMGHLGPLLALGRGSYGRASTSQGDWRHTCAIVRAVVLPVDRRRRGPTEAGGPGGPARSGVGPAPRPSRGSGRPLAS